MNPLYVNLFLITTPYLFFFVILRLFFVIKYATVGENRQKKFFLFQLFFDDMKNLPGEKEGRGGVLFSNFVVNCSH